MNCVSKWPHFKVLLIIQGIIMTNISGLDLNIGLAEMLKGGVIMDVVNAEQADIAEKAGAVAVMALERVPSDIRADGGVARMSNPTMITEIVDCTSIPVMAKCRIGHTAEARVLEALGVDMIDESEVLTPADPYYHVVKDDFTVPFVCGPILYLPRWWLKPDKLGYYPNNQERKEKCQWNLI